MPPINSKLDVGAIVSINKRFLKYNHVKEVLRERHDWSTDLSFRGKTIARSEESGRLMYDVVLDEVPDMPIRVSQGSLKYLASANNAPAEITNDNLVYTEDLLDDAVQVDEEEGEEMDLTPSDGWFIGEVHTDARLEGASGYTNERSHLKINDTQSLLTPLNYFFFFLPMDHLHRIVDNTNIHARKLGHWTDITFNEYLMWITFLTIMTVVRHCDKRAYWRLGPSHLYLNIDFTKYMSYDRFFSIMKMHIFDVDSKQAQQSDPLHQIRSTVEAFNNHMTDCIEPGKYLIIDESINMWLSTGIPILKKKVPRKSTYNQQEFQTMTDHDSHCVLRIDTVNDPCSKEFDNESDMKNLTASVKRLVKPWFKTGRTVVADSWFGSPDMTMMLIKQGLYSIMQVTKHKHWPQGMPAADIAESVGERAGCHFTMKKQTVDGQLFVCAHREQKVKAYISSCGVTALEGERTFKGSNSKRVTSRRPAVVDEYETHKSAVNNNDDNPLRDNMIYYANILGEERWEIRFLGYFLGLCEANAYAAFKKFSVSGGSMSHASFKDNLAFQMLNYCENLEGICENNTTHYYTSMGGSNTNKRRRLACSRCRQAGITGTRVEKSCTCDPDRPLCKNCHIDHLQEVWNLQHNVNNYS